MRRLIYLTAWVLVATGLPGCGEHAATPRNVAPRTYSPPEFPEPGLVGLATKYGDKFPDDVYFWADPQVYSRLHILLGNKFPVFLGAMQMKSRVLNRHDVLIVTGSNMRDRTYAAVFAFDLKSGELYVKLRERGRDSQYPPLGVTFALPDEIKSYSRSWSSWPESIALAQGKPKVSDEPVSAPMPQPRSVDRTMLTQKATAATQSKVAQ
jgi:hypothetical protein